MIELILIIYLCSVIGKLAKSKGESAGGWIFRYLSLVISLYFVVVYCVLRYWGEGVITNMKSMVIISAFGMAFELILFFLMKRRLEKMPDPNDHEDDDQMKEPPKEEKDLSYFR